MIKQFFDRRGEKRSLSGAKARLFNEVYKKIAKSECKFIFFSFRSKWLVLFCSFSTHFGKNLVYGFP